MNINQINRDLEHIAYRRKRAVREQDSKKIRTLDEEAGELRVKMKRLKPDEN